MATLEEIKGLREDPRLLGRVTVAVERAAVDILNEAPETADHAKRMAWAKRSVLTIGENRAQAYASLILRLAFVENASLQEKALQATDNDVQFIVNSYIEKLIAEDL